MNLNNLKVIIERDSINYSTRYRFNPIEDSRCQTTRKGKMVLHRRLVHVVLGINFPKTHLKVVEKIERNGQVCGLLLQPIKEPQADRVIISRFKFGAMLVLNVLFYRLNLDYKRFQYSFISEPLTLDDESVGIRLTLETIQPWPEYLGIQTNLEITLPETIPQRVDASIIPFVNGSIFIN